MDAQKEKASEEPEIIVALELPERSKDEVREGRKELVCRLLKEHGQVITACEGAGMSTSLYYEELKKDPAFRQAVAVAKRRYEEGLLLHVQARATRQGQPSDTLLMFALNRLERQQSVNERLLSVARVALRVIEEEGRKIGIKETHIEMVRDRLLKAWEEVKVE